MYMKNDPDYGWTSHSSTAIIELTYINNRGVWLTDGVMINEYTSGQSLEFIDD